MHYNPPIRLINQCVHILRNKYLKGDGEVARKLVELCSGEEFSFKVKEENRVGTMRVYFDGDVQLCNSWFPSSNMRELANTYGKRLLVELQDVLNDIMFNKLNTFDKVIDTCGGYGYDYEANRFTQFGQCNYWIRLIPAKGDYNYYIKDYIKEDAE